MDYEYDVFISYTRQVDDVNQWVREIFYPIFLNKLRNNLGHKPKVFLDNSIETGMAWENKLRNALAKSKTMIAIYVPDYFRSEWCQKEFWAIHYRQKNLGFNSFENERGIIWPIQLCDGKHYPIYAWEQQVEDFREYFRCADYFKKTEGYLAFENQILSIAERLADLIDEAPPWQAEWATENWWTTVMNAIPPISENKFRQPKLWER